jgi:DNA mismatch repair protein MutS2
MQHFDEQAIKDLEFDVIRLWLHDYCVQPTARLRMVDLVPMRDARQNTVELRKVDEFVSIRRNAISFPAIDFEELEQEVKLLQLRESVLSEESFSRLYKASVLVNEIVQAFDGVEEALPHLFELVRDIEVTKEIQLGIERIFDTKWKVKDDASPDLGRIRSEITNVRRQIARNFAKVMKDYAGKGFLGDTGEAYINERKVLAIYSTHKRKVNGIVMGSSKTGSLTYIEPEINIQLNFELESLFEDERNEVRKILLDLTNQFRHRLPLVRQYQRLLTELDFVQAKARLALDLDACLPELTDQPVISLNKAFHPVLMLSNRRNKKSTFPQSMHMDTNQRILVISGPNAGGKSITLKTIGLLQVMLQSGLLVPVAPSSKMSFFTGVLTDIGDNQSIENQLSTYSYRLKRMKHFLDVANRRSLVLLDEFGTGSDPDLGGALAEVFFEQLYQRKVFGVITTHYSNIKLRAAQLPNAMNGCMLFNTVTLEPTYQLSIGQPGSSFTFEVAEINGIPVELINAAKKKLSRQKVQMDEMLSSLQEEKTRYEILSKSATDAALLASNTINDFEKRKDKYEEKLSKQQETIERNNKYLIHGRKLAAFIEGWQLRAKNKELLEEIKKYVVVEKSKIEEERKQKTIQKKISQKKDKVEKKEAHREKIKVGSLVRLENTKQTGKVIDLEGTQATVAIGVFKTKVNLEKLEFIQ